MKKKPNVMALIFQWVVIPLVVAALGYWVIGPRIGKPATSESTPQATGEAGPNNHAANLATANGPSLSVSTKPLGETGPAGG